MVDLGNFWEEKIKMPVPLGGIAISQSIKRSTALQIDQLIRKSLEYAFSNYPLVSDFVKQHSQEMREEVMRKHIDLYVNNYSLGLGNDGREAIRTLYNVYLKTNNLNENTDEELLFL